VIEIARDVDIGAIMRRRIERSAHETRHGSVIEQRFYAIAPIKCTFNNLQATGDCQTTRKYAQGGELAGDFTGEK
jgi:hypothetical protein